MKLPAVYLHGFASSIRSAKAQALRKLLGDDVASYAIADLEADDFPHLTMDLLRRRAAAAIAAAARPGAPALVIGSSLGGYLAALIAGERRLPIAGLVLVAPAFRFPTRWRERFGEAELAAWHARGTKVFFHHGVERELPLGYAFLESCIGLPDLPPAPGVPTAIVHGRGDDTVAWRESLAYTEANAEVELHLVDGDHRLTEPRHEALIAWCAREVMARVRNEGRVASSE